MAPYVHPQAICESTNIGEGTRIWAFAHVLPGAKIGAECNVCDGVFIENDVVIGDRVTIKCGVQVWDGVHLDDDVFIGPNATFTNDMFPRSKVYPEKFWTTKVGKGASIGANATILPGIEIGPGAMVGAGAVVTQTVPPNAIVVGNPAHITGYANARASDTAESAVSPRTSPGKIDLGVGHAALYTMKLVKDLRGDLSVGEFEKELPFIPKRYFMVFDVPSRKVRGEHAHRICHQFLICVRGSCSVLLDDGTSRREVVLDRVNLGVHMPPMVWGAQYRYSEDAILLVFASEHYDADDYIRSYEEFQNAVRTSQNAQPAA